MIYEFEHCILDTATQELHRDGELVAVEPQVFAVLELLLANPGRVVTKIELLDEVWGDRFVSEAALTSRIKLARQACGDSGRDQRIIKTVHGRGYRLATPIVERGSAAPALRTTGSPGPGTVGRDAELTALTATAAECASGEQRTVFVRGATGAGKSTVVAEFVERTDDLDRWLVLRGRCHRARSGPEPYFALLDALGGLAALEPELLSETLERVAPSWLLQLPTLVDDETAARLERRLLGGARQRMLREGAEAFTALSKRHPTLLIVEDLHLADDCTLDVLELISTRHDAVPLLIVATTRPGVDPVEELRTTGGSAGSTVTVDIGPLDRDEIGRALADRHPGTALSPELVDLIHDRCGGNPLLAHELVAAWTGAGVIVASEEALTLAHDPHDPAPGTPDSLIPLVERTLHDLDPDERSLLEAAAAAGFDFDAAAVAAGLGLDVADAEAALARLARRQDHVIATGATTWPDGTVATTFVFTHRLYVDVIRDRTAPGTGREIHRRIGLALEDGYAADPGTVCVALADHFVAAGDAARSARHLRQAARLASERYAHGHAVALLADAMEHCQTLDPGRERDEIELAIRLASGQARVAVAGWREDDVAEHYARALELAQQLGAEGEEANARYGLATISELHGEYERTEQLLTPLIQIDDGDLAMEAHELVACSTFHQGAFERSESNSSAVLETWPDDTSSELMAKVAEHPATSCNSWLSLSNWFLGRSDDSIRRADDAVRLGEKHTYALAMATQQRAMLHQLRNEPDACLEWADRTTALERAILSRVRMIQAELLRGWALSVAGHDGAALDEMADALDRFRAAGVQLNAPYYLSLHADALMRSDRAVEALALLDEAEATIDETTRTYFHRPEIARLRARAILRLGGADALERARASLEESLELAWAMGSPTLALRATADRFELERRTGDHERWRSPLRELVDRYDGQAPPPDVVAAREALRS